MAKISFSPEKHITPIEAPSGGTLMEVLLNAERPVASSCGGQAICGKCKVQIIGDSSGLSEPTELENALISKLNLGKDQRLSCQALLLGDVTVDTPYW